MPVKMNFFFRYGAQGWSESFYRYSNFNSGDGVLLDNYINKRMKLASTQVTLISVRSSDVDTPRDVTIKDIGINGMDGTWVYGAAQPTAPNQTAQAVLLRMTDGAQHYRTFNLLGIPDHIILDNMIDPDEAALLKGRLDEWQASITAASFQMRLVAQPTIFGEVQSYGVQTDAAPLVKLVTTQAPPAKGSLIQVYQSKPWKLLNRVWRVASSTGGVIALAGSKSLQAFGEVEGGRWRVPAYSYAVLSGYTLARVSVRKTGVPFGVQRGRRSARM
jgi:hypothetical protein